MKFRKVKENSTKFGSLKPRYFGMHFLVMTTFLISLFMISFVSAEAIDLGTYSRGDNILLRQTCSNGCSYVNFSLIHDGVNLLIDNEQMIDTGNGKYIYLYNIEYSGDYELIGEMDLSGTPTSFHSITFSVEGPSYASSGFYLDFSKTINRWLLFLSFAVAVACLFFKMGYLSSLILFVDGILMLFSGIHWFFSIISLMASILIANSNK